MDLRQVRTEYVKRFVQAKHPILLHILSLFSPSPQSSPESTEPFKCTVQCKSQLVSKQLLVILVTQPTLM